MPQLIINTYVSLTLWPWSWTFTVQHTIYVKCEFLLTKKGNIRKYTTFCGGINEDGERKSKIYIYLLTNYIKRVLWGGAVRLSYI